MCQAERYASSRATPCQYSGTIVCPSPFSPLIHLLYIAFYHTPEYSVVRMLLLQLCAKRTPSVWPPGVENAGIHSVRTRPTSINFELLESEAKPSKKHGWRQGKTPGDANYSSTVWIAKLSYHRMQRDENTPYENRNIPKPKLGVCSWEFLPAAALLSQGVNTEDENSVYDRKSSPGVGAFQSCYLAGCLIAHVPMQPSLFGLFL